MKISREEWRETYFPNWDEDLEGYLKMYEADDLIGLKKDIDPHYIWTELSDMFGTVVPGARFVDRFCYYITEKPWKEEDYHTLEVTDLITRDDFNRKIAHYQAHSDEETVELLQEMRDELDDFEAEG